MRRRLGRLLSLGLLIAGSATVGAEDSLVLHLCSRDPKEARGGIPPAHVVPAAVDPHHCAVVVCDMWERHWCRGATARVAELAPRIDAFLKAARRLGVTIVHAPSSCMDAYKDHPARARALAAPRAPDLPEDIGSWCHRIPAEEAVKYPIDQSDGGCDCEPTCRQGSPWRRQIDSIEIEDEDYISDRGAEIWNILAQRSIRDVLLVGVHTNMCVLGRPFGLRNLARHGKRSILVRDLTDTMYNSRRAPFVSHFRGTDLIVRYIETCVSPTITSADLLGGEPFRFRADDRPEVVVAIGEELYQTRRTLPAFARDELEDRLGLRVRVLAAPPKDRSVIPGLRDALRGADLLLLSLRRRALPEEDLAAVRAHLEAGRPLVAIRTSSHAFDTKGKHPPGHAEWKGFDAEVLGGSYHGHGSSRVTVTVEAAPGAIGHPILAGVKLPFTSAGSLYRSAPLRAGTTALLVGRVEGEEPQPVAWTHRYRGARVFYTSLGHPRDFETPSFRRLLRQGIRWALAATKTSRGGGR